jgi:hypothetical protein
MVQGTCAHLQLQETKTAILDRLNVIIDRLNVIISGSVVYMKIVAKVSKGAIWQQYLKSDQVEKW